MRRSARVLLLKEVPNNSPAALSYTSGCIGEEKFIPITILNRIDYDKTLVNYIFYESDSVATDRIIFSTSATDEVEH